MCGCVGTRPERTLGVNRGHAHGGVCALLCTETCVRVLVVGRRRACHVLWVRECAVAYTRHLSELCACGRLSGETGRFLIHFTLSSLLRRHCQMYMYIDVRLARTVIVKHSRFVHPREMLL